MCEGALRVPAAATALQTWAELRAREVGLGAQLRLIVNKGAQLTFRARPKCEELAESGILQPGSAFQNSCANCTLFVRLGLGDLLVSSTWDNNHLQ